ncbi:hypothetical protein GCM10017712_12690 [Curtobacterium citreum]
MDEGGSFVARHAPLGNSSAQFPNGSAADLQALRAKRRISKRHRPVDVTAMSVTPTIAINVVHGTLDGVGRRHRPVSKLLEQPTQDRVRQPQGGCADHLDPGV